MEYRKLGRTDIDVSVIALGCWPFAGGEVWGHQEDADSVAAVHAALEAGINFFDTAEGYGEGHSERVLAQALKGRRDEAVIASKVSPSHLTADAIRIACEGSLRNLGTDYMDLYYVHWPNHDIPLEETAEAMDRLKGEGKIRSIGVSNFGVQDLNDFLGLAWADVDQLPYNLIWRAVEYDILPLCLERGVGLVPYSPLAQGILTGRYATPGDVPDGLARSRHFSSERSLARHGGPGFEGETFAAVGRVREIAADLGQPMSAVSLAWVRQQPGVTSMLVGARNAEEVSWNLPAVDLNLSDDVLRELSSVTDEVKQLTGSNPDMWHPETWVR